MAKKLVVSDLSGTIYDATMSKKDPSRMTDDRVERTDECIRAVANHMHLMATENRDNPGWYRYNFPGFGTLTFKCEVTETLM